MFSYEKYSKRQQQRKQEITDYLGSKRVHKSHLMGSSLQSGFMLHLQGMFLFAVCTVCEYSCNQVDIVQLCVPYIMLCDFCISLKNWVLYLHIGKYFSHVQSSKCLE